MQSTVIYHGPSLIDGEEIIAVVTGGSKNTKTGAMLQTWIMRADVAPHIALKSGADASVCGQCRHRPVNGRPGTCYVKIFQAPLAVYRAFHRGQYAIARTAAERSTVGSGRIVRVGSYGDSAAVPAHVWVALLRESAGRTGYTHQWQHTDAVVATNAALLRPYLMASTDSERETIAAHLAGWRTFRAKFDYDAPMTGEIACPASAEAGHKTTCADCRACSGVAGRGHSSIVINLHGAIARAAVRRAA